MAGGFLGSISGSVRLNIGQAVAAYAALRAQNARTVYALRGTGDAFVATGQTMATAGAGMVYVFGKAVQAAAEFERKMDFFAAVTNASGKEMQALSAYTLQLAQDTIYSAGQIADGFIELGKAGVDSRMIIEGIGEAMANLGAAGDIPLAQSGQIITSTIQQFDMAASDAVKVVDLLAGAANASIADITDIGVSLKYVGGVANAVGLDFEDTATAISLLAKAGIRGSTAGTSLRQMLVSLGGATGPATDQLKALGIITEDGTNKFFTAEGKAKSLGEVFQILQKHTEDLTAKERLMALKTIFNNRALAAASILTREGAEGFRLMNDAMSKTTAADVASERLDNLSGDIEILRGNIETLLITAGGPFQETFRGWVQSLTKLVQAFSDLDPATQKFIVQTIGITGAALLAMGVFNIIVGTLFRFAAHMLKLGAAIGFALKWIRAFLYVVGLIVGGTISVAFLAIAAAVIAIGAAFIIAYKRIEPFRNFVNGLGQWFMDNVVNPMIAGIQRLIGWFKTLATDPKRAWDELKNGAVDAVNGLGNALSSLGSTIGDALGRGLAVVGTFIAGVVRWFMSLPGRVLGIIGNFVGQVTELFTFRNIGYAIGFMIGTVIRFFTLMGVRVLATLANMGTGILGFFASLPGRIGYLIGFLVGTVVRLWIGLYTRLIGIAARIVTGIISFFIQLPGRIRSIAAQAVAALVGALIRMVNFAASQGPRIALGVINGIISLPGRMVSLFGRAVRAVTNAIPRMAAAAVQIGIGIYDGINGMIAGLPGVIGGVLGNCIEAFRGVVQQAFNAARDFAAGLWNGFKDGLGINSPSLIEKQMTQMTGVIDEETKKMARQTMHVQNLSKRLARTQLAVPAVQGAPDLSTLSKTRLIQKRAGLVASSVPRGGRPAPTKAGVGSGASRLVEGKLAIDDSGKAWIRGFAEDVTDEHENDDDSRNRRNL